MIGALLMLTYICVVVFLLARTSEEDKRSAAAHRDCNDAYKNWQRACRNFDSKGRADAWDRRDDVQ